MQDLRDMADSQHRQGSGQADCREEVRDGSRKDVAHTVVCNVYNTMPSKDDITKQVRMCRTKTIHRTGPETNQSTQCENVRSGMKIRSNDSRM